MDIICFIITAVHIGQLGLMQSSLWYKAPQKHCRVPALHKLTRITLDITEGLKVKRWSSPSSSSLAYSAECYIVSNSM